MTKPVKLQRMSDRPAKRTRVRNEEIAQILARANMTQEQAAVWLSQRLGRDVKNYHIGRAITGDRQPTVEEMDGLRELPAHFEPAPRLPKELSTYSLTQSSDEIPLFGAGFSASSDLRLDEDGRIGMVRIHPAQRGSKASFAFVMPDDVLGDRLREGDTGFAIRGQPPTLGQPCIVERTDRTSIVRIYDGRDTNTLFLSQLKPVKKLTIALREISAVHAVVGLTFGGSGGSR